MEKDNSSNMERFNGKNLLAIDYGTKVIGLAYCCPGRDPFPTPFGRVVVKDKQQVMAELNKILVDEAIAAVVIGLPHHKDGNPSQMTEQVKRFAEQLARLSGLPFYFQDETLSSFEAEERMKNSPQYNFKVDLTKIDAVAASIILEDFLKL